MLDFAGRQPLDVESVNRRALQNARHDGSAGKADFDQADRVEQPLAAALLEPTPKPPGFDQQWDIIGMFEIGLADDPRLAMRTSLVVPRRKTIEDNGPGAAPGELTGSRGSHAAGTDHDHVAGFHRWASLLPAVPRAARTRAKAIAARPPSGQRWSIEGAWADGGLNAQLLIALAIENLFFCGRSQFFFIERVFRGRPPACRSVPAQSRIPGRFSIKSRFLMALVGRGATSIQIFFAAIVDFTLVGD